MRRRRRRPSRPCRPRSCAGWSSSRQRSSPVPGCRRLRRWRPCGSSSPWPGRPWWRRSSRRWRSWPVPTWRRRSWWRPPSSRGPWWRSSPSAGRAAGGGGLLGRARRGGDTGGRRVHRHGDALVSESAQDDAAASGSHVSGAHGLGHLAAGHRAGRGPLADEGLQGLVSELRRECARLGGLVGHRRHRLPFVADGRTPRAREATVRKRRGRSCATPGRGAGWCSAGVVTRCAHTL